MLTLRWGPFGQGAEPLSRSRETEWRCLKETPGSVRFEGPPKLWWFFCCLRLRNVGNMAFELFEVDILLFTIQEAFKGVQPT